MPSSVAARPFLTLRDASFRLGDRLVFKNTTWTWFADQQWAVLGPNGSGKSLFADALRGRLPLVAGSLQYHFRAPTLLSHEEVISHVSFEDRKHALRDPGILSRWNSLEEETSLSVREHLAYERVMDISAFEVNPQHGPLRAAFKRRLARASALFEILPLFERSLITLSNGERQRVELAKALSRPFRLLMLDDPFMGLDRHARARLLKTLEDLMRSGVKVLLIGTKPEDLPRTITHILQVEQCAVVRTRRRPSRRKSPAPHLQTANPRRANRSVAKRSAPASVAKVRDEILVQISNATVRYGQQAVLRNVHWTIRRGQSWALLGPNGSGKSTLLALIMGDHQQAYTNNITVFGMRRGHGESVWEIKRRIGWLSPDLQFDFPDESRCLHIVASGLGDPHGRFEPAPRSHLRAARRAMLALGIHPWTTLAWHELSPGQQRLVLLARALVKKPDLLILDEPCQGIDARHRREIISILESLLRRQQLTVIYVTHRLEEIPPSITRVLRLPKIPGSD